MSLEKKARKYQMKKETKNLSKHKQDSFELVKRAEPETCYVYIEVRELKRRN